MRAKRLSALRTIGLVMVTAGLAGVVSAQREGAQAPRPNPLMPPERELAMKIKGSFTFTGVGDIIIRHPFAQLAEPGFQSLVKHLRDADVGFANMEGTVIDYDTFPHAIGNGQPKSLLADLKSMGIRMVNTANNHSLDSGEPGVFETIRLLKSADIVHAGTGGNLQEARTPGVSQYPEGRGRPDRRVLDRLSGIPAALRPEPRGSTDPSRVAHQRRLVPERQPGRFPGLNPLHVTPVYSVSAEELAAMRKTRDAIYTHRSEVPGAVPAVPADEPTDRLYSFGQWYKAGGKPGEISLSDEPRRPG